jgi:hypothetical protein
VNVIFLDIDGVLNGHDYDQAAQSTRIQYRCVRQLNHVIRRTGAKVVLSSAWRYMLLKTKRGRPPAMQLIGFEYLMRTHGTVGFRLLGTTASDEDYGFPAPDDARRAKQVRAWLDSPAGAEVERYVVIDDDDWGFTAAGMPFVQTRARWGLNRRDAAAAVRLLNA